MKISRFALILWLALASFAWAQNPPLSPTPPGTPVPDASEPSKTTARERTIYVPFEKLEQVFEQVSLEE